MREQRGSVEQDELDYDMQQGQWEPVKPESLFIYADDVSYKLKTDNASTLRPDACDVELDRQERANHAADVEKILNRLKQGKM